MIKKRVSKDLNHDVIIDGMYPLEIINIERKRIASELHDSLIQSILGILYKTQLCVNLIDYDLPRTKDELRKIYQTAKDAISETREIIYELYSFHKEDPIVDLIRSYINKKKECWQFDITVDVIADNTEFEIKPTAKLSIIRVIQEAINNIDKHSEATNVMIKIKYNKDSLEISIIDNGVGFNIHKSRNMIQEDEGYLSGYGLNIMKDRVKALGGEIIVSSIEGEGTNVLLNIKKEFIKKGDCINEEKD